MLSTATCPTLIACTENFASGASPPPFIVTFATMYACRGLGWVYLRNRVIYPLHDSFRVISTANLFKIDRFIIKSPVLIAIVFLLVAWFVLRRTNIGRKIYFTGASPMAARRRPRTNTAKTTEEKAQIKTSGVKRFCPSSKANTMPVSGALKATASPAHAPPVI